MGGMNPVIAVRTRLKLSRLQMARHLGVTYTELAKAELGYPSRIPQPIIDGLAKLGVDGDQLQREYQEWRQTDILSKFRGSELAPLHPVEAKS